MPQYAPRSARRHVRAGEFLTIPICPSLRGWPAPGTAALSGFPPTARDVAGSRSRPVLRARSEERLRVVTIAHGQPNKIPAGHGISRSQAGSATDFPS